MAYREPGDRVMEEGGIYRTELPQRRRDGSLGWYDASVGRVTTGSDEHVVAFVDITQLKTLSAQLAQSRTELRAILDNVPARITCWNADLTNRFANREA